MDRPSLVPRGIVGDNQAVKLEKELRDISVDRLLEYLSSLPELPHTVLPLPRGRSCIGSDWTVELRPLDPINLGSMKISRLEFVVEGTEQMVHAVWAALEPKLIRGGA
jgi:hypothetical protein